MTYDVELKFPPPVKPVAAGTQKLDGKVEDVREALRREAYRDLIIPQPKKLAWGRGVLELAPGARIVIDAPGGGAAEYAATIAADFATRAKAEYGTRADHRQLIRQAGCGGHRVVDCSHPRMARRA